MRISVLSAAWVLAACLPAAAQSLKPGLWEINHRTGGNAAMDPSLADMHKQLAAMPPEQRKQMEAMMGQRGMAMAPGGGGMAVRVCMTQQMADRNEVPMQDGCRITSQSRSGNTMKMTFACTDPPSSGDGQFTFASAEAYTSRMTVKTAVAGRTETTTTEAAGKWLGADCGRIRPPMMK